MTPPKTLTADQCHSLLTHILADFDTQKQLVKATRNSTMVIIMLETGIRVGELCGLRIDDLWYANQPVGTLILRKEIAKNKIERHIPISKNLFDALILTYEVVWSHVDPGPTSFAFFSFDPSRPLTTRTIERMVLDAGKKSCNLEVTPHMLRHTFASKMMRKTNARVVQALLGHSSLQSTQIYMHPNSDDLKKAIDA